MYCQNIKNIFICSLPISKLVLYLVGLASYFLINFWFTRLAANLASLKAFLINRIGDWGLMLGQVQLLSILNDLSFPTLFSLGYQIHSDLLFCSLLLLMIGAMAKSAQFGLHTWLSDAMEGLYNQQRALLKFHYMREHPETLKSTWKNF